MPGVNIASNTLACFSARLGLLPLIDGLHLRQDLQQIAPEESHLAVSLTELFLQIGPCYELRLALRDAMEALR
jgi:hypothetical protein